MNKDVDAFELQSIWVFVFDKYWQSFKSGRVMTYGKSFQLSGFSNGLGFSQCFNSILREFDVLRLSCSDLLVFS